jgi:hypothetical protein
MNTLEDEYYFICKPKGRDDLPSLKPDEATAEINYDFEALPLGQKPLKFVNAWHDDCRRQGIKTLVPPVLFDGTNMVIDGKHRMRLVRHGDIPNLHIYPAIYVDDEDRWHEDYWYLTFTDRFDCWDRKLSDYEQDVPPVRLGGYEFHQIYKHVFDVELMKRTPLEQRLLFKLGGTLDAFIVAHTSILTKFFGPPGVNGADYIRVSDY